MIAVAGLTCRNDEFPLCSGPAVNAQPVVVCLFIRRPFFAEKMTGSAVYFCRFLMGISGDIRMAFRTFQKPVGRLFEGNPIDVSAAPFLAMAIEAGFFGGGGI